MNNKQLGSAFERKVCEALAKFGWWVHFISPDNRGAQPFDVIAVRDGIAVAIDCKTSARPIFPISRLEDNQIFAFDKWLKCGNKYAYLVVEYQGASYAIDYQRLKLVKKVNITDCMRMEAIFK